MASSTAASATFSVTPKTGRKAAPSARPASGRATSATRRRRVKVATAEASK